jgi:hypothetical protein
MHDVKS